MVSQTLLEYVLFLACCLDLFFGDDVVNGGPIVDMSRIDPSVSVVMLIGVLNSTKSSKRLVIIIASET
jgi:hypothetical protein